MKLLNKEIPINEMKSFLRENPLEKPESSQ